MDPMRMGNGAVTLPVTSRRQREELWPAVGTECCLTLHRTRIHIHVTATAAAALRGHALPVISGDPAEDGLALLETLQGLPL